MPSILGIVGLDGKLSQKFELFRAKQITQRVLRFELHRHSLLDHDILNPVPPDDALHVLAGACQLDGSVLPHVACSVKRLPVDDEVLSRVGTTNEEDKVAG